tara:strand:- start:1944 stop:2294 length:351 start_codon:yes stop_codon:yes gene_type:complete
MAIKITDECINCGACEAECPNTAIYEGGIEWTFAEGTQLTEKIVSKKGLSFLVDEDQEPNSYELYYIVTDKCTECKGFHEKPQCAAVCPVDCCVLDENHQETEKELLSKKAFLHCE